MIYFKIRFYGRNDDFKKASKKLRDEGTWGLDDIVKQGDAIFNNLHRIFPDLRHGLIETSSMSYEKAEYCVDTMQTI